MKTFTFWPALLGLAIMAGSCANEAVQDEPMREGHPVTFRMSLGNFGSRTVTDAESRVTSWSVGDAVGIFVYNDEQLSRSNVKYTFDGNSWTSENGIVDTDGSKFYAYYPYSETASIPTNASLSVQDNQASGAAYGKSDVLAARNESVTEPSVVALSFAHQYSMVEVSLGGDLVTAAPASVVLRNVRLTGTLNLVAGTVTTTGVETDVTMSYLGEKDGRHAYRAVIPAQTVKAATPLLSINGVGGKDYTFQYSADVPYEKGAFRVMKVTISTEKPKLEIPAANMEIDPWNPSGAIEGGGEEVVVPPVNLISVPVKDLTPATFITYESNNLWEASLNNPIPDYWYSQRQKADPVDFTAELVDDPEYGKALKFEANAATAGGSWFKGSVGYHHQGAFEAGWYKLTFRYKANIAKRTIIPIIKSSHADTTNKNWFFLNNYSSAIKAFNNSEADTWYEAEVYYNLGKITTKTGSTGGAEGAIDLPESDGFNNFQLRFYTGGGANARGFDAYVTDVNLIKVDDSEVPAV